MSASAAPHHPDLVQLRRQAKELRAAHRAGDPSTRARLRACIGRLRDATDDEAAGHDLTLREAQFVIARENGFDSWAALRQAAHEPVQQPPADAEPRGSLAEADNLLKRVGGAFELREDRQLRDVELQFLVASAQVVDTRRAQCDVPRMQALLQEHPWLLGTVGAAALAMAVSHKGCDTAVDFLLENGVRELYDCETGLAPKDMFAPVAVAFYCENLSGLKRLFDAGISSAAVLNLRGNRPGPRSLLYDSYARPLEYARFALRYGADPEVQMRGNGERGRTVLQHTVAPPYDGAGAPWDSPKIWQLTMQMADLLLEHGAHYDIYSACGRDDLERVQQVVADEPTAINETTEAAMTPLHWAIRGNAPRCAQWLLQRGVDVDAETVTQRTALHMAAEWGSTELVWMLAQHGAFLDQQDSKGRSPLHRATYMGKVEAAEALIVLGADTRLETSSGKTPLQLARFDCRFLKP